ncbi:molybdopterin-dependent oxidoreductase [Desulfoplanes formicivorans]|uniref:Molybdopterin oxidoreductase n=1 Tax=Desulfoplanes formicivorans TaxID=1592317 RepID=A0A194AB56_9BACT|nr:molybdopterin-dependent oxidoreductase [Desulfoplanes formicivorans]GAU07407.1 molybdopterin oxidoreductase [Desulfoplanes formicivorans]
MNVTALNHRATIYRFLATLFRDEPCLEHVTSFAPGGIADTIASAMSTQPPLASWLQQLTAFLDTASPQDLLRELRYEYADLFLNAGPSPVFPYASVHVSNIPVVQQEPLFQMRQTLRTLELHVDPEFRDLDEHVSVTFEICAILLEREELESYDHFLSSNIMKWVPAFCDQLATNAQSPFYRVWAEICRWFLEKGARLNTEAGIEPILATLAQGLAGADLLGPGPLLLPGAQAPLPDQDIPTHCYTCGALCGMTAKVRDGVLIKVAGLKGDPKGDGRLCPKGGAATKHVNSAYRLKAPLIRENNRFRKASWDEALDLVAARLATIPQGKLAYFRGNDFAGFVHETFFDHLGCPKGTHRTMCDNSNRMANEHNLNDKRPWINYQQSDYIILFGNNELATSYGQRKTAQLKAALKRGAKLVVFDPRKSETAAKATTWIPIKPGTDGAAAMAMAYVIITEDLYDKDFVRNWTTGFNAFRDRILGREDGVARTPQWAEAICEVPAKTLQTIAREFAGATAKGVMSWSGLAQTPNGHWATAAIQALNGLCGTFDAPGGPCLPWKRKLGSAWRDGQVKPEKRPSPKMDHFQLWSGWSPAKFEEHVADGRIKGLVSYWADPVLTWGNTESVTRGIRGLDFCVTIDAFMCNTALESDVVLPDATWLEQSQIKSDWLYEAFLSYFAQVVKPMYDSRPMYRIVQGLAERMGVKDAVPWKTMDEAFANQMRDLPWDFQDLKKQGFLITNPASYYKYKEWGSINPPKGYGSSGTSRTGKYNFLNPVSLEKGVDALPDHKEIDPRFAPDTEFPFIFGNFRILQHEHCSTFNNYQLMKLRKTNTLIMNNEDALRLGIAPGETVTIASPWGKINIRVEPTPDMKPGVLGAAGGYGHVRGLEGDAAFPDFGGVNVPGALMPPNVTEPTGGTPLLKYIKAKVIKA